VNTVFYINNQTSHIKPHQKLVDKQNCQTMLRQIRFHRIRFGPKKQCYCAYGEILYKPFLLTEGNLDILEEHLDFLNEIRSPKSENEKRIHALLLHENTHSERQLKFGTRWFMIQYQFSRRFRLAEEKLAFCAQIKKLVQYGFPIDVQYFAYNLSGPVYGHMVGYREALEWVRGTVKSMGGLVCFPELALELSDDFPNEELFFSDEFINNMSSEQRRDWWKDRLTLLVSGLGVFVLCMMAILIGIELTWGLF